MTESGNGSSTSEGGAAAAAAAPAAAAAEAVAPAAAAAAAEPEKKSATPLSDAQEAAAAERANAGKKEEEDARQAAFEKEKDAELAERERESSAAASVVLEIPEHVKHNDGDIDALAEATPLLAEAGYTGAHAQRLVDLIGEEAIAATDAPRWEEPDAVLGYLRMEWGSEFQARLKTAQQTMKKLPAKMQAFLEETGLGNAPSVLNTLANLGEGLMGLSKSQAFHKLEEMRKSGPYRDAGHRDHKLAVARARVLTQAASFGDNPEAKERVLKNAFASAVGSAARGEEFVETKPAAKSGDQARVEAIRKDPAYRKGSKSLVAEMNTLMARLYPGDE